MHAAKTILALDVESLRRIVADQQVRLARTPRSRARARTVRDAVREAGTFRGRWTKQGEEWCVVTSASAGVGDLVLVERVDGTLDEHVVDSTVRTLGTLRKVVRVLK